MSRQAARTANINGAGRLALEWKDRSFALPRDLALNVNSRRGNRLPDLSFIRIVERYRFGLNRPPTNASALRFN